MSATFGREPLPVIEEVDEPPIEERTAWHESGHAVIGHALGFAISIVTLRPPARVVYAPAPAADPLHEIAKSHAGYVGEMARTQFWSTGWPDACDYYLRRVEAFEFGGCDDCQMAMSAWRKGGFAAGIDAARETMMLGQQLAVSIGQRRVVQNAIRTLAGKLMQQHTIAGPEAHAIIEQYVKFGAMTNVEENKEAA